MYLNYLFPGALKWSPIMMVLSVVLMINYRNLFSLKFPSLNMLFIIVGLFQCLMIIYYVTSEGNGEEKNLPFHLYVISLIVAYSTASQRMNVEYLPSVLYIVTLPCLILGVWYTSLGMVSGELAFRLKNEMDGYAIEPFTVCTGSLLNIFSALCIKTIVR